MAIIFEYIRHARKRLTERANEMTSVRTTAIVLAGIWALGVATSALGRFVHVLAVVAVALLLVEFATNRRVSH